MHYRNIEFFCNLIIKFIAKIFSNRCKKLQNRQNLDFFLSKLKKNSMLRGEATLPL